MSDNKHQLVAGESLASVAARHGLSIDALREDPNNAALFDTRGSGGLKPGDELDVTKKKGTKALGSGRTHEVVASPPVRLFEVRAYTQFRLASKDGDRSTSASRWPGPAVMLAEVVLERPGSESRRGLTSRAQIHLGQKAYAPRGSLRVQKLDDGTWTLRLTPQSQELSKGPAGPDPAADHGLGFWEEQPGGSLKAKGSPTKDPPTNGQYEVEYRPLEIEVKVAGGKITAATVVDDRSNTARPLHATLFWKGVPKSADANVDQILEVDWRPDFVRRVVLTQFLVNAGPKVMAKNRKGKVVPSPRTYLGLSPFQRKRQKLGKGKDIIEILFIHQTTGNNPGSTLQTFLANNDRAIITKGGVKWEGKNLHSGSHYLVDRDGHVIRMVDDRYLAEHGGGQYKYQTRPADEKQREIAPEHRDAQWEQRGAVNDRGLGIENCHKDEGADNDPKAAPYTDEQYKALAELGNAIKSTYNIAAKNVIGHQDATGKARCPGPHMHWEKLEAAGVSLAPKELTPAEKEAMLGGFFGGDHGTKHRLQVGDAVRKSGETFSVHRGTKVIAEGLTQSPVKRLHSILEEIGYSPLPPGDKRWNEDDPKYSQHYEMNAAFCIGQFIRHYCTGTRYYAVQKSAYKHNEAKFFVDFDLAVVLEGAAKALGI